MILVDEKIVLYLKFKIPKFSGILYDYSIKGSVKGNINELNTIIDDSTFIVLGKNNNIFKVEHQSDIESRKGEQLLFHIRKYKDMSYLLENPVPSQIYEENLNILNLKLYLIINSIDKDTNNKEEIINDDYCLNKNDIIKLGNLIYIIKEVHINSKNKTSKNKLQKKEELSKKDKESKKEEVSTKEEVSKKEENVERISKKEENVERISKKEENEEEISKKEENEEEKSKAEENEEEKSKTEENEEEKSKKEENEEKISKKEENVGKISKKENVEKISKKEKIKNNYDISSLNKSERSIVDFCPKPRHYIINNENMIAKCYICKNKEETLKDNPLIAFCSCNNYIHFKCLKHIINIKKNIIETKNVKNYYIKRESCKKCKYIYPLRFKINEEEYKLIDIEPLETDYIILESLGNKHFYGNYKLIHVIELNDKNIKIGRDIKLNNMVIGDPSISKEHAVIIYNKNNGSLILKNKSRKYGTLVLIKKSLKINENKIQLQIGKTNIEMQIMKYGEFEKIKDKKTKNPLPKKD